MELDARRLSFAMSASLAKSVSESAKRADRRDSSKRTSSNRFFNSIGGCNERKERKKMSLQFNQLNKKKSSPHGIFSSI